MKRAMRSWGPDGISAVCNGQAMMGFANLAITPEAVHEALPTSDPRNGILFTAAARLDNRDELCDFFRISAAERPTLPDSRLVLQAWRQWGKNAPDHLFGDWSFAVWDSRRRELFLARDQLGNTGMYYYCRPHFVAFASDPEGLFALKAVERRANETYIASYLALFPMGNEDDTCWTGIRHLASGCSLTVTPDGQEIRRYWEIDDIPPLVGMKDEEYVAGFLERFRTAVTVRLRSRYRLGTSLSAGLDSGSVTALAAESLMNSGESLTAFTSVPLHPASHLVPGALADEWPLASAVAAGYGNIEHCPIDAVSVTPLAGIRRAVEIMHAPQHAAANEFWVMAMLDAARERNIGVMLTGQLGNGGVSWSGGRDRIFLLFATGKWDEGIRAMAAWKRQHGRSWFRAIAGQLVNPLIMPYWSRCKMMAMMDSAPPWADYSAMHPDFAKRSGALAAMRKAKHDPSFSRALDPGEERRLTLVRNGTMAGPIWHATGAAFGLDVRDPTADARLLEFCLRVPPEQDTHAGGERMLIRRAMEGILPPEVQWNRIRGRQAADVVLRLLRHGEEMDLLLERLESHREVRRYLDLPLMRRVWSDLRIEVSQRTARRAASILLRGAMCGSFLEYAGKADELE